MSFLCNTFCDSKMRFYTRRRAFTLIELLCAIAIIAILFALYLGVFPKAFEKVKKLETRQKGFNNWVTNDSK
jgi:prepilin-type N-terminal cleavage/methylation domain-containing protein